MTTIGTLRSRIDRRMAILALLLAGMLGTGLASLALVTDSLTVNNNFTVLTIDLRANAEQGPLTFNHQFDGTAAKRVALTMNNAGNGQLRYSLATSASGSIAPKIAAEVFSVTSVANCNAGTYGPLVSNGSSSSLDGGDFGSAAQGQQTGDRLLAAAASEILCMVFTPLTGASEPQGSDTGQQVALFSAESTANNP